MGLTHPTTCEWTHRSGYSGSSGLAPHEKDVLHVKLKNFAPTAAEEQASGEPSLHPHPPLSPLRSAIGSGGCPALSAGVGWQPPPGDHHRHGVHAGDGPAGGRAAGARRHQRPAVAVLHSGRAGGAPVGWGPLSVPSPEVQGAWSSICTVWGRSSIWHFGPQLGMRMRLIWVSIQGGNAMGAGWVACCRQLGRVAESGAPRPTAGAATFAPHQDHLPPPPRPI